MVVLSRFSQGQELFRCLTIMRNGLKKCIHWHYVMKLYSCLLMLSCISFLVFHSSSGDDINILVSLLANKLVIEDCDLV